MSQPSDFKDMTYVPLDEYQIASWSPGEVGENVPPTQVHLILPIPAISAVFVVRLKSVRACDELIDTLIKHRDDVFGAPKGGIT